MKKILTFQEFNLLNEIAESTKMDCWFSIKQTQKGQDYVFDLESRKRLSLRRGIKDLLDGVTDVDILGLSDEEKFILIQLLINLI